MVIKDSKCYNMDGDDLLFTNKFSNDNSNAGYGLTSELRRHKLREHVERKTVILPDPPPDEHVLPGDILLTNPVINDDNELRDMDKGIYTRERRIALHISSTHRKRFNEVNAYDLDDDGNYVDPGSVQTPEALNNAFVPSRSDYYRPYFTGVDGKVKKLIHNQQYPSKYSVTLPAIRRIKSIRLLSTEIPFTMNNVDARNNILILSLRYAETPGNMTVVTYDSSNPTPNTSFPFILIQLKYGNYQTIDELIEEIEERLNVYASTFVATPSTVPADLFDVTFNKNTGKIAIKIRASYDDQYDFHLKFMFDLDEQRRIRDEFDQLWSALGFPWPYEINTDGTDKYTTELNNLFDYGIHPITGPQFKNIRDVAFLENSAFAATAASQSMDTMDAALAATIAGTNDSEFKVLRPYRFPHLAFPEVMFMYLNGLGDIHNVLNSQDVIHRDEGNRIYFAKIQLNADHGEKLYNTDVDTPYISPTPIHLEKLDIAFYTPRGGLVDFGDVDHSFTLEIIQYVDVLESAQYDSQRGRIDRKYLPDSIKTSSHPAASSSKGTRNQSYGL